MTVSEIWNTPSYYYALSYALCAFSAASMYGREGPRWRRWAMLAGLIIALTVFMAVTTGVDRLAFALTMLTVVAMMYLALLPMMENAVQAGFFCCKAFVYGEFTASLCWQVYYSLLLRFPALQNRWAEAGVIAVMLSVICEAIWLLERRLSRGSPELNISGRDLAVVLITGLSVYVVSNLGYIDRNSLFSGSYARDIFAIRTLADLSGAAMLYAYHNSLCEVQLRLEKEALRSIMESQYRAYQITRESIDLADRKYHDLKHQLALIRTRGGGEYVARMEQELQDFQTETQTGNAVLDAVLTLKLAHCARNGIELKAMADGARLSFMDDMEVSALFGNLLDNAIEAVEQIPDREKRLIRLNVDARQGFLRIRVENTCAEKLSFRDGLPVSTKRDGRFHGFGMKSMQKTVGKYGGSLLARQEGERFEVNILIPLAQ